MSIQLMDLVGDIVTSFPRTAEVFKQFRIDFCCGGNKTLLQAIRDQDINEELLLQKLGEASVPRTSGELNWNEMSASDLIDFIIRMHHDYLRTALPQLSEYTNKIARVHGPHHPELFEVHQKFEALRTDMEHHMEKEESVAFPVLIAYESDPTEAKRKHLLSILAILENEHEGSGDLLKQIREMTCDYELPEDACTTFQLTYLKLEELEADMFRHIHLENNILFKRF